MITTALPMLTARPERGQSDLPNLVAFYQTCEQADPAHHAPTLEQLQHRLDHPPPGGRYYRQYWETVDGQLVGVAALWIGDPRTDIPPQMAGQDQAPDSVPDSAPAPDSAPELTAQANRSPEPGSHNPVVNGHLGILVHPSYRHQGLEPILLDWAEAEVQTIRPDPNIPVHLRVVVNQKRTTEQAVYEAHGFRKIRWFQDLQRPLSLAIEASPMPPGFVMQRASACRDEDCVALFNDTFVDHWQFVPLTLANYQYHRQRPSYQPDLDWVAVAEDGTLAGFCAAHIPHEENARRQRQEGWITILGTRRGYRRQGLGRAMLLCGLQHLQAAGLDTALIGVDRDNPNQAKTLYESVGFRLKEGWLNYGKVLT